jgi:hypothetical protein
MGTGVGASGRSPLLAGRRMIEMEVCGHWTCTAWLYAFVHELGDTAPQPCDEGFRCRRDQIGAANHTRSHRAERPPRVGALGRFIAEMPIDSHTEEVAGRLGEGRWGRIQHRYCGSSDPPDARRQGSAVHRAERATFGRDGSDRTAASAELNVSRETLCRDRRCPQRACG